MDSSDSGKRNHGSLAPGLVSRTTRNTSVLVIGGGLSGLAAAKLLSERNVDVMVLEARDRVGGRMHTAKNNVIHWVDLGASYVGPTQNHILRLSRQLGIKTYKTFSDLKAIHFFQGKRYAFESMWADFGIRNPLAWFDINYVMHITDLMMAQVPVTDPWNCLHAEEWDKMTLQAFFEKHTWTRSGLDFLRAIAQVNYASDPDQVSLLWALWYVKCCDGNRRISSIQNGAQERKFDGGSMAICEKLQEILGERVELGSKVCSLTQDKDGVHVTLVDGREYTADYVIMAIPLPMQLKIHYDPPLPHLRNQLIQRSPLGSVIKVNIYYRTPFWRKKGYNGGISCSNGELSFNFVADDCKPGPSLAALTVYVRRLH